LSSVDLVTALNRPWAADLTSMFYLVGFAYVALLTDVGGVVGAVG
jgi:hypothetical protein